MGSSDVPATCNAKQAKPLPSDPAEKGSDLGKDDSLLNQRYELGRQLGAGVSAKVYVALDRKTNKKVAIKVYEKWNGCDGQFQREVKNLTYLNSKDPESRHVYRNVENFQHQGKHCIVLDYYSGTTIKQEIINSSKKGLPVVTIRKALAQLLGTFDFLEGANVIHGDLKPDNAILVGGLSGSTVRLIDFGLSYRGGSMQKNMYIQSRWYRSPEVLLGIPATTKIDVWSAGCLCAEMFLGFAPFRGYDSYDQMQRIAEILCLPNERMRGDCEATTLLKLDELAADVRKKRSKGGGSPRSLPGDQEAAAAFRDKLITHRKTKSTDVAEEVALLADFCSKLLVVDPKLRLTAKEALAHPFLAPELSPASDDTSPLSDTSTTLNSPLGSPGRAAAFPDPIASPGRTLSSSSSGSLGGAGDKAPAKPEAVASPARVGGFGGRTPSPTRSPPKAPRGECAPAATVPATAGLFGKDASKPGTGAFAFKPAQQMRKIMGRVRG